MSEITTEKLQKAFAVLNKLADSSEISKAEKEEKEYKSEEEMEKEYDSKFKKGCDKEMKKSEEAQPALTAAEKLAKAEQEIELLKAEAAKEEEIKKSEALKSGNYEDIFKSIDAKFGALGEILKGVVDENANIKQLLSQKEADLAKSEQNYQSLANEVSTPKSIQTKEYIQKGESQNNDGKVVLDSSTVEGRSAILAKGDMITNWSAIQDGNIVEKSFANDLENFQYGTGGITAEMIQKFGQAGYSVK